MPQFSVIIPTYNRAHLLKNLIGQFLAQSFNDFELIVVDDGSTDHTKNVVKDFEDERIQYFKKENGGVSSARNHGMLNAKGTYINFFDSDDYVYPNHLEVANNFFKQNVSNQVLLLDYEWGDSDKKKWKRISHHYKDPNKAICYSNYISTNAIFIEKQLLREVRFNEQLRISEDWLFWIQLSVRAKFHSLNTSTSFIVEHSQRSVNEIKLESLIAQKDIFTASLKNDSMIKTLEHFSIRPAQSHFNSFIALNAALNGKKSIAVAYFLKSLDYFPGIFSRRSLAIIKHVLFNW